MMFRTANFVIAWVAGVAAGLAVARTHAADKVDFSRDIRPILSNACFACHGPDEKHRQGDLRLDQQAAALAVREGKQAVAPGKPDASELIRRITSTDPEEQMPPKDSGKSLTKEQIELLKRWIAEGAGWGGHWAFTAPKRPKLPAVKQGAWVRNPIDQFVLARLEREGLRPAPEAERATLLRRWSLDLVGLPPSLTELDAYLLDNRATADREQVDRLLKSPHYGERWARQWLDAARYADSDGYEKDKARQVWFYRDWVVAALNRNLPYDQFIIQQIAGDLLPGATQDQLVATGFLRNSMINEEGGVDPEQFRMEAMYDRMDAIGKGVLGVTIQCAQCHNHKFDPLTQEDYYRLFAFLNDTHEANIAAYTPAETMERANLLREMADLEADLRHRHPDWPQQMAAWEKSVRENQPAWTVVRPAVDDISTGGQKYLPLEDGSFLCQGYAPTKHTVKLTVKTDLKSIAAFRLELLTDPNLPLGGPGRSIWGTGALSEFRVEAAPASAPDKRQAVKIARATSDCEITPQPLPAIFDDKSKKKRTIGPVAFALDGNNETAWCTDVGPGRRNQPRKAVFVAEQAVTHDGGTVLTVHLTQNHGGWNSDDNQNCNLGRLRLSVTSSSGAVADPLPAKVREILDVPVEKRTPSQAAAVLSFWRTTVPAWQETNGKIEALWKRHPAGSSQLVLTARETPRTTSVLDRGDFLKPKKAVAAGVPNFLHTLPASATSAAAAKPNRLDFARWLVARESPTTARTLVNRIWQAYFGQGLVSTAEDFGSQGDLPTHPELLDWLAVELMDHGWDVQHIHRLIVQSATYRQASRVTPELATKDPYNRLLARGPRFRVEAEVVRDIALAASGLISLKLGGPSVYPPAPEFLFQPPASYGPKNWYEETGENRYRRALYTFRYRSVPYPMLQTFDAPNGDFSCVRRARSNTPLQALTSLNEPLFVEAAQALAQRTLRTAAASDADRLTYAFRVCTSRSPSAGESQILRELLDKQLARFTTGGADPAPLIATRDKKPPSLPPKTTPAQLAAWTTVARVLLNLDETITKE